MLDIRLTYSTPGGPQEIAIEAERTSLGRGSEADHRFADDGLSRLHAIVYREGDRVWIVDNNSTNGTLVNGEAVKPSGTPLNNGDIVRIGHQTNLRVTIAEQSQAVPLSSAAAAGATLSSAPPASSSFGILPVVLIAGAIFVISVTTVIVGFTVFGSGRNEVALNKSDDSENDRPPRNDPKDSPTPRVESTPGNTSQANDNSILVPNDPGNSGPQTNLPAGKKYYDMSDAERRQYLGAKAMRVAQIIGNNSSDQIPSAAVDKIKSFADGFASRIKSKGT